MKVAIVVLCLAGLATARPQLGSVLDYAKVFITAYDNNNNGLGDYSYNVKSSDGQERGETRTVINAGTAQEKVDVTGYYKYIGTDGEEYLVGYRADENGFQPEGERLVPSANARRRPPQVGIPSAAISTLSGSGLGR